MRSIRIGVIILASCAATSGANDYGNAAALAGVALGAAVVNRAVTGDCFAYVCAYGTQCDHDSGMCVPIQEKPREVCPASDAPTALWLACDAGAE